MHRSGPSDASIVSPQSHGVYESLVKSTPRLHQEGTAIVDLTPPNALAKEKRSVRAGLLRRIGLADR